VEKVAGTDVEMVQKTDYPWNGNVSITVNPKESKRFTVYVRVPNRTTSELYMTTPDVSGLTSLSVNGKAITPKIEKGYAVVTREWKAGDRIDLELPLAPQRLKADPQIEADRGRVALRYGPLIYNVERADQSDINQPLSAAPLKAEWHSDLLGGVMALKGTWANGKPMLAIPNYARMNRIGQVAADDSAATDPSINYAPGSTAPTASTNTAAASGGERRRRSAEGPQSIVWMKDEAAVTQSKE
jgi:hypothetical protein